MKLGEVRRFANEEVVGQRSDGLFFEAYVEERAGKLMVVESDCGTRAVIDPVQIRWLAKATRYC